MEHDHHMVEGDSSLKEYLKFAGVVAGIALAALALNTGTIWDYLRYFMGSFFIIFGSFKLIGYEMFTTMFAGYDVVARRYKTYAYLYPFIEIWLALFYLLDFLPATRDIITLIIMAVGSIGVFQEIRRRSGIHCACLGNIIKLPLSTVSLVEDVGMVVMAVVMLIFG